MTCHRSSLFAGCLLIALAAYCEPVSGSTGQETSGQTLPSPEIFAPGVISGPANDGSPTFSPDGNTLFFTRSSAHWSIILESHRAGGGWSAPKIAPFSGEWSDSSPAMSPDGAYLIFVSMRPMTSGSAPAAQGEKEAKAMESHIWRVQREGSNWGTPMELPESVNFCRWIFRPSVAADGSIYFTAAGQGKELRLFRSQFEGGTYRKAEPLPFSDGTIKDVDPEIAPDQSFLVFSSRGRGTGDDSHEKLFIVYKKAMGGWSPAEPIHYEGDTANGSSDDNDPRLSSDHRTLYFSSDRTLAVHFPRTREQANQDFGRLEFWDNSNSNIWSISLTSWLKAGKG